MTREERRLAAKAKKEAAIAKKKGVPQPGDMPSSSEEEESEDDIPMPANPNHSKAARSQASAAPVAVDEAAEGVAKLNVGGKKGGKPMEQLSRREREAVQAQQAKERYQKLHEAGKTDEAKADLARLALIKEKREAEAARKKVYFIPYIAAVQVEFYLWLICMLTYLLLRPRKKKSKKQIKQRKLRWTLERRRDEKLLWDHRLRKAKEKPRSNEFVQSWLFK